MFWPSLYRSERLSSLPFYRGKNGDDQCVQTLMEGGVEVNHANANGGTALMRACRKGHYECARSLI